MFHTVNEINHVKSPFINQLRLGLSRQGGRTGSSQRLKTQLLREKGWCLGLEWGGQVSKSRWAPNPAGARQSPSSPLLKGAPFSVVAGAAGAPLPETDCLLLFLHLAGITSVSRCVICCPIATCKPSFLLGFLARRCPQLHGLSTALRSLLPTWDASPPVLESLPQGAFCSEK